MVSYGPTARIISPETGLRSNVGCCGSHRWFGLDRRAPEKESHCSILFVDPGTYDHLRLMLLFGRLAAVHEVGILLDGLLIMAMACCKVSHCRFVEGLEVGVLQ